MFNGKYVGEGQVSVLSLFCLTQAGLFPVGIMLSKTRWAFNPYWQGALWERDGHFSHKLVSITGLLKCNIAELLSCTETWMGMERKWCRVV